jgi:hypothetical protein
VPTDRLIWGAPIFFFRETEGQPMPLLEFFSDFHDVQKAIVYGLTLIIVVAILKWR